MMIRWFLSRKGLFPFAFAFINSFILLLFIYPNSVKSAGNNDPYFTSEMWPGEGIPRFRAKIDLQLLEKPTSESKTVKGIIRKGENIKFISTRYITIKPEEITIEANIEFPNVRKYGKIKYLSRNDYYSSGEHSQLILSKGQKIKILQYRAEGEYLVEFDGEIYGTECSICTEKSKPETEWWILVVKGAMEGWIQINNTNVDFQKRSM